MENKIVLLLLGVLLLGSFIPVYAQNGEESAEVEVFDIAEAVTKWWELVDENVPNIIGAQIVGIIGSTAYYGALKLGFVGGQLRDWLLDNFDGGQRVAGFIVIGGGVAVAFQLAQPDVFVPIQSFVLGVTWPFIVAQYVSRVEGRDVREFIAELREEKPPEEGT